MLMMRLGVDCQTCGHELLTDVLCDWTGCPCVHKHGRVGARWDHAAVALLGGLALGALATGRTLGAVVVVVIVGLVWIAGNADDR